MRGQMRSRAAPTERRIKNKLFIRIGEKGFGLRLAVLGIPNASQRRKRQIPFYVSQKALIGRAPLLKGTCFGVDTKRSGASVALFLRIRLI